MRTLTLLAIAAIWAQAGASAPDDPALPFLVQRFLRGRTYIEGFDIHELQNAGDQAAIVILRSLDPKKPTIDQSATENILWMLNTAFSGPAMIQGEANKDPAVALLLVRYLKHGGYDVKTMREIASTEKFLVGIREHIREKRGH